MSSNEHMIMKVEMFIKYTNLGHLLFGMIVSHTPKIKLELARLTESSNS